MGAPAGWCSRATIGMVKFAHVCCVVRRGHFLGSLLLQGTLRRRGGRVKTPVTSEENNMESGNHLCIIFAVIKCLQMKLGQHWHPEEQQTLF